MASKAHDHCQVSATVNRLLARADSELGAAVSTDDPDDQFLHAHLAALRTAAAVVELRGRPGPRSGARTVWEMLNKVAPELGLWSVYFASGSRERSAIESGLGVEPARAAELIACAEDFRDEVAMLIDPNVTFNHQRHLAAVS